MPFTRSSFLGFTRGLGAAALVLGTLSAQTVIVTPAGNRPPAQPVPAIQADWSCGNVYYVATNGNNGNDGSFAAPWRTITFAVSQALSLTPTGNPITINVRAGTYQAGETFPITLPARGIKLQAFEPNAVVRGQANEAVLKVDRKGSQSGPCGFTPDTVIRGLTLREGREGIWINTFELGVPPATTPDRVRIERCTIVNNTSKGILLEAASDRRSQHVIEENQIAYNANTLGFGHGIRAVDAGDSSYLIRANHIHNNEVGIEIWGPNNPAAPDRCKPRIVSNIVHDAEWGISLAWCSSHLVNNTQGYGRPFSLGVEVKGVVLGVSGHHTVANNIIWNDPAYANPAPVIDYEVSGVTTTEATNHILQVVGIGNAPHFVAPPTDLHLLPTSPWLLDAGTSSYVLPVINITAGTITARADVGMDFDGDSRVLDFDRNAAATVDIGADELTGGTTVRLEGSRPDVDTFGNVHTNGVAKTITLELTAMPNDLCIVYFWNASGADPTTPNTFVDPFGNWRITPGVQVDIGMAHPTTGLFTTNLQLDPALLGLEREVYVQAITSDSGHSLGTITNRLMLEINR